MVTLPHVQGFTAEGFEAVRTEFARTFTERGDVGAAFAAYHQGRLVVDLWGGFADRDRGRPWSEDTLQLVFSGTKGLVSLCVLLLLERGLLDLDAPVRRYWPEFGASGKEDTLVRHVVSHQAGLPGLRSPVTADDVLDDVEMAKRLAGETPFWAPGECATYHPLTFGWLCGELIRRVDGRSVGAFFAEEIAGPLGLELWIGLPEGLETRVSVLTRRPETIETTVLCEPDVDWAISANPPLLVGDPAWWNSRACHGAEIPGANGIGSARSIARLFGCLALGGELDGVRVIEPGTLELAQHVLTDAPDACYDRHLVFGVGFWLQDESQPFGPVSRAFGHGGAGGSMHGAWPEHGVGFSYVMNHMSDEIDRATPLLEALFDATAWRRAPS